MGNLVAVHRDYLVDGRWRPRRRAQAAMTTDGGETDLVLVRAAQGGDKAAFAALLARHRPLLHALCRRTLGDPDLAEDAAQEAALQALLSLDRLRRPDRFGPWLAGIGLNVCRRWRRDRGHWRSEWSWEALCGGRLEPEPADWRPGPAELAEAADLNARVRRAVADLPPGQRSAVLLVYLSGLTQAETAAALGIEVGAVKTRLHKARATLRQRLWDTWKENRMATDVGTQPVEMRVADVRRLPAEGDKPCRHVVVLEEVDGSRRLPIWMGDFEGTAIALHLEQMPHPRPLTYAFTAGVLEAAGGRVREVRIERLIENTFYAATLVEGPTGPATVDARPSDALNLALRTGAPIFVAPAVLDAAAADPRWEQGSRPGEGPAAIVADLVAIWAKAAQAAPASGEMA